jgi:hypothetical protein
MAHDLAKEIYKMSLNAQKEEEERAKQTWKEKLDNGICFHINYTVWMKDEDGNIVIDEDDEEPPSMHRRFKMVDDKVVYIPIDRKYNEETQQWYDAETTSYLDLMKNHSLIGTIFGVVTPPGKFENYTAEVRLCGTNEGYSFQHGKENDFVGIFMKGVAIARAIEKL